MRAIALRYGDAFAPPCGTIESHREILKKNGFVWYGKIGLGVSKKGVDAVKESKKVLLIHSGKADRYWLDVEEISNNIPPVSDFPLYYSDKVSHIRTWLKITAINNEKNDVLSKCTLVSNNRPLSEVSKSSMSPYFIIEYTD